MADQRFFQKTGPYTLQDLAKQVDVELSKPEYGDKQISDVAPLDRAGDSDLSFLDNVKYLSAFKETKAAACVVHPDVLDKHDAAMPCIISKNPYLTYARIAQVFYPGAQSLAFVAPSASVDETAEIGADCYIGAGVYIGPGVRIGDRCRILPGAVIMDAVEVGDDCEIGPNASLSHCVIGARVKIYPGACIGQAGFGFAIDRAAGFVTVPQLGRVIIEDDVEVGANSTIDRGAGPDTIIGRGTRIDNLVQIGHNVQIGRNCVIVAQAGISGSTKLDDFVMMGGQSGIAGHLHIGAGVKLAAQSGVMRDIPAGEEYMGSPAMPMRQHMRQIATLLKMTKPKTKKGGGSL